MADINQIVILGLLGRNAEMRYGQSGLAVVNLSVATTRKWKSKEQWQEETEWHKVVVFGKMADKIAGALKGQRAFVVGRKKTRKYTGQDGVDRTETSIIATVAEVYPRQPSQQAQGTQPQQQELGQGVYEHHGGQQPQQRPHMQLPPESDFDDDIPF